MAEQRRHGRPASPGIAIGPLFLLADVEAVDLEHSGDPAHERHLLDVAIQDASAQLRGLADSADIADGLTGDILAIQIELLDDPALVEEALRTIGEGVPAATAWRQSMEVQIEEYRAAEDEYFRARAADLTDLMTRVLDNLGGTAGEIELPDGSILGTEDLTPSRFLALDRRKLAGIALGEGSPSAHVAMLARARGVPMITGLGEIDPADAAILDAESGLLILEPSVETMQAYELRQAAADGEAREAARLLPLPARTRSGDAVQVMVNVDDPDAVSDAELLASDGVGLMRTEFLFIGRDELPDEESQFQAYATLLRRLQGRPLTIRTLDVGGDKPLPGISLPAESNPFLGLRGIRLCLEKPELFRPQVRALLRAARLGPVSVMLPMVVVDQEVREVRSIFAAELASLSDGAMPPLGIMVETPAAALAPETITCDFLSIGSNDLTQYVMAASRDSGGRVALLNDPLHPAVLRLIGETVAHGRRTGLPVSLCGDMAADPKALDALLDLGLRRISVAPAALGRAKLAVSRHA